MNRAEFLKASAVFLEAFYNFTPRHIEREEISDVLSLIVVGINTGTVKPWVTIHTTLNKYPESRYMLIFIEKIIAEIDCYYKFSELQQKALDAAAKIDYKQANTQSLQEQGQGLASKL